MTNVFVWPHCVWKQDNWRIRLRFWLESWWKVTNGFIWLGWGKHVSQSNLSRQSIQTWTNVLLVGSSTMILTIKDGEQTACPQTTNVYLCPPCLNENIWKKQLANVIRKTNKRHWNPGNSRQRDNLRNRNGILD